MAGHKLARLLSFTFHLRTSNTVSKPRRVYIDAVEVSARCRTNERTNGEADRQTADNCTVTGTCLYSLYADGGPAGDHLLDAAAEAAVTHINVPNGSACRGTCRSSLATGLRVLPSKLHGWPTCASHRMHGAKRLAVGCREMQIRSGECS